MNEIETFASSKYDIFISYDPKDIESARRLYNDLKKAGIEPWFDEESLLAGHREEVIIREAIKSSHFFAAMLSSNSVKRNTVIRQISVALKILEERPESDVFIIPIRLDDCKPSHQILDELHNVDMFLSWEDGMKKIFKTIQRKSCSQINAVTTNEIASGWKELERKCVNLSNFIYKRIWHLQWLIHTLKFNPDILEKDYGINRASDSSITSLRDSIFENTQNLNDMIDLMKFICQSDKIEPPKTFLDIKPSDADMTMVTPYPHNMDANPITNFEYYAFLMAHNNKKELQPLHWQNDLDTDKLSTFSPVLNISFEDANAFAKWAEKDIPTEEEWIGAARDSHEESDRTTQPIIFTDKIWEWTYSQDETGAEGILKSEKSRFAHFLPRNEKPDGYNVGFRCIRRNRD